MKINLFVIFLIGSILANSQGSGKDFLIDKKGEKIYCKISQIKNSKVKFRIGNKSYSNIKGLWNYQDIFFSDSTIIKNKLNTRITKPISGYAHIYFYVPSSNNCIIYRGDKEFLNLKAGSFYLNKVEALAEYTYRCRENEEKESIKVKPNDGEIVFITMIMNENSYVPAGGDFRINETKLYLEKDNKLSRLAVLSMQKEIKKSY